MRKERERERNTSTKEQGKKRKGIGKTARKGEIKETRERKKTESSLSQNQKPKAEEWEYLLSPYIAQDSQKSPFSLLSLSTKHQITLKNRPLLLFFCDEDFWTGVKAERKHFLWSFFAYSVLFHVSPAFHSLSTPHCGLCTVLQTLIHLTCKPYCWKVDHTSGKTAAPDIWS